MGVQVFAVLSDNEGIRVFKCFFFVAKPVLLVWLAVAKHEKMGYINTIACNTVAGL